MTSRGARTAASRRRRAAAGDHRRRRRAAVALTALLPLVAACGEDDPYAAYCETVAEHQHELTETLSSGGEAALIEALPILRDLEEESPRDVAGHWTRIVTSLEQLEDALREAGVEPTAYDAASPPAGLTQEQTDHIAEAADAVGSERTMLALATVEQQVRDVCHTPLTL